MYSGLGSDDELTVMGLVKTVLAVDLGADSVDDDGPGLLDDNEGSGLFDEGPGW